MKNAEKYIKFYEEKFEESFRRWGYYYPPRNWDELYAWEDKIYKKYLSKEDDDVIRTKCYTTLLDTTKEFGFYVAFQQPEPDYGFLNNVLYQTSRQRLIDSGSTASGTDHCVAFYDALNSFACNDFEIIDHFFPKSLPHSKGAWYTEVSVNLLKVLYYHETGQKESALQKAEKFLSKKITSWEKYCVLYLLALIDGNAADASNYLQELCAAYQRIGDIFNTEKSFASRVHGLYRLGRIAGENFFNTITRPHHHAFFEEFEVWQKENNYPKGELFYRRPPEMDYMNKIFEAELPFVELEEVRYEGQSRTNLYKNTGKFARDLTENVKKLLPADYFAAPAVAEDEAPGGVVSRLRRMILPGKYRE
jgi:hypothetical protein